jgi:hypothetical protein
MMLKVISIDHIQPFEIICSLNDGSKRMIDVKPLLEKHHHFAGISDLLRKERFMEVEIGQMGEICWRRVIHFAGNEELWDYDISPEFIFYEGKQIQD